MYELKRSLYRLEQSPRQWYKLIDSFMIKTNFSRCKYNDCVYSRRLKNRSSIYSLLYADNMLIASRNLAEIKTLKASLNAEFGINNIRRAKKILGIEIHPDRKAGKLWRSQRKDIEKVLESFSVKDSRHVSTSIAGYFNLSSKECPKLEEKEKMFLMQVQWVL